MKTQINEELNLIKYLFDYKKGKVISEQNGSLLTEADGKTKEEYPACVQNLGDIVTGGGVSAITDKQGNSYYSNNKATLQPGTPGNTDQLSIKNVDYFSLIFVCSPCRTLKGAAGVCVCERVGGVAGAVRPVLLVCCV